MVEVVEVVEVVDVVGVARHLGSEMRSSLGSLKAACAWLVKAPGVNRPAIDEQPMYLRKNKLNFNPEGAPGELEHGPLRHGPAGHHEHVKRVLHRRDRPGAQKTNNTEINIVKKIILFTWQPARASPRSSSG